MPYNANIIGEYVFETCNGKRIENEELANAFRIHLTIIAGDDANSIKIHGKVVNNLNGVAKCEDGKFKAMFMSTRMAGPMEIMSIEDQFNKGFDHGMTITRDGDILTLASADGTIVFKAK